MKSLSDPMEAILIRLEEKRWHNSLALGLGGTAAPLYSGVLPAHPLPAPWPHHVLKVNGRSFCKWPRIVKLELEVENYKLYNTETQPQLWWHRWWDENWEIKEERLKEGLMYTCMADSCCYAAKTNTTL